MIKKNLVLRRFIRISAILLLTLAGSLMPGICNAAAREPVLRVGSEVEFPPFAFIDEQGQIAGFSIDLINAVAKEMELPIVLTTGSWDTMWNGLVKGQLDILPIVAKLPERQSQIDFSLPHTETFDAFFVREGNPMIRNLAAVKGKKIVVMRSDAAHHALLERKFIGTLTLVDTIPEGLILIASGQHDAFLCSKLIGVLTIRKHGIKGLTAGPPIPDYKRVFAFGIKKGSDELREKLNQGLLIIKLNGEYDRIYEKWLSFDDPWRKYRYYLLSALLVTTGIILIAVFWMVILGRQVKKRTAELAIKNEALQQEIGERKRFEMELTKYKNNLERLTEERTMTLRAKEERHRSFIEVTGELGWTTNADGEVTEDLPSWRKYTGQTYEEFKGRGWAKALHFDDLENVLQAWEKAVAEKRTYEVEYRILRHDGIYRHFMVRGIPVFKEDGGIREWVGTCIDVTERKIAEELIQRSLKEKEVLLKEIHHRVKNNLQVVRSLLNLQANSTADKAVRAIFEESRNRVASMSLIHEKLYGSADLSHIDFKEYLQGLVAGIAETYKRPDVVIYVEMESIALTVNVGIPCGLIVNELVSNSLKYAFPDGRAGTIKLGINKNSEGNYVLSVFDNGIGFPESVDFRNTESLGLQLVNVLAGQINGTIEFSNIEGARFSITFPGQKDREFIKMEKDI